MTTLKLSQEEINLIQGSFSHYLQRLNFEKANIEIFKNIDSMKDALNENNEYFLELEISDVIHIRYFLDKTQSIHGNTLKPIPLLELQNQQNISLDSIRNLFSLAHLSFTQYLTNILKKENSMIVSSNFNRQEVDLEKIMDEKTKKIMEMKSTLQNAVTKVYQFITQVQKDVKEQSVKNTEDDIPKFK